MFCTVALAAAVAALALPVAAATTVTVNLAGLDAPAAQAKIVIAAETACSRELQSESALMAYYEHVDCVNDAVARAAASVATANASQRAAQRRLASR